MYFDYTNAFGPKKPCIEAERTANRLKKDATAVANTLAVFEKAEKLIEAYRQVLSPSDVCRANSLCWGMSTPEDYLRSFMVNVIMNFRIWEVSEAQLNKLRMVIALNNPEWLNRFDSEIVAKRERVQKR